MIENIAVLQNDVAEALQNETIPLDKKKKVDRALAEYQDIVAAFQHSSPFRAFLRSYITDEYDKFQSGDRERPLCECNLVLSCQLKQGAIPSRVLHADSVDEGLDHHSSRHPEEVVLSEARREFSEGVAAYREALRRCKHVLAGVDEDALDHIDTAADDPRQQTEVDS